MKYIVGTKYQSCTIKVTIHAKRLCTVWLEAYDSKMPNTFFTNRFKVFKAGEIESLYIQMPISGKHTMIEVYEHELKEGTSDAFEIVAVKKMNLARQMDVVNMQNPDIRHFVRFAQRFAFNAAVLPTYEDRYYVSDSGEFKIMYTPIIADKGREVFTPARITIADKVIDVSKAKFTPLTVPARMCILAHEFSHLFINEDMYNELEADLNGLIIYLGLGYPRIEAREMFSIIIDQAPTDENKERYKHIDKFIDEFESLNFEHL